MRVMPSLLSRTASKVSSVSCLVAMGLLPRGVGWRLGASRGAPGGRGGLTYFGATRGAKCVSAGSPLR